MDVSLLKKEMRVLEKKSKDLERELSDQVNDKEIKLSKLKVNKSSFRMIIMSRSLF